MAKTDLSIQNIAINELKLADYNPRKWDKLASENLRESVRKYGLVDPLIVNGAENRKISSDFFEYTPQIGKESTIDISPSLLLYWI